MSKKSHPGDGTHGKGEKGVLSVGGRPAVSRRPLSAVRELVRAWFALGRG